MLVETLVNRPGWFQSVPRAVRDLQVQGHPPVQGRRSWSLSSGFLGVCVCVIFSGLEGFFSEGNLL